MKIVFCSYCNKEIKRKVIHKECKERFCNNSCKGEWQKDQRRLKGFTKEWLYEQYWTLGKNTYQIGRELNKDPKSIWTWLKVEGIKTRSRGFDTKQQFKKGQESTFKGKKHTDETKEKIRQKRLEDGHVPYLKNGIHWLKHENAVSPNYKGGITPDRQSFYSSIEWVEVVKMVWERDNAVCKRCNKKHNTEENRGSFHIHHIESFMNKEKRANLDNLVLLCRDCHLWIHSKKNTKKEFIINES